jgi:acid phosphatase type 7
MKPSFTGLAKQFFADVVSSSLIRGHSGIAIPLRTVHPAAMKLRTFLFTLALLPLAALTGRAQSDVVGVFLTWQRDPTTTMTVNWVNLYEHTPATVWLREAGAKEWSRHEGTRGVIEPSVLQVRRVELTGLKPGTNYEFALGDSAPKDNKGVEKFRTMPADLAKPVRFVTGGDMMHSREMVDAMNTQAGKLDPDFALLGGDLSYANDVDALRWIDWLQSWHKLVRGKGGRLVPMVVVIGNHEVKGGYHGKIPDDARHFYSLFALPEQRSFHALDFGRYLSLLVLDSEHTQPIAGAQAQWLDRALGQRAGQQFVFACYHYPAYGTTKAPKGKLPCEAERSIKIRTHWLPIMERYGVSAVFENDHHNFKRTHRIRNHQRDDANGLLFLGDGAWGVNTRTVPSLDEAWYLAAAEPRRHLFHVTMHGNGTAKIEAVDAKGEVFDQVELATPRTKPVK